MLDFRQIADDLRGTFRGSLHFDAITRGLYATDASPFEVTPAGVAVPADAADVAVLVRYCHEHGVAVVPRGAGTGVAGESLGPGIVVDLSQSFRRIVGTTADTVTVEPGVVYAELSEALARAGRRFAPDPASGKTCTVGGMVATNASGGNAFRFGYTRDYVLGLGVVWDDGTASSVGQGSGDGRRETGRTAEIADATTALLTDHRELIALVRPQTPFNRCGYVLHDVLADGRLDLPRLLAGSEGTLAVVTEVTLRTVPLPGGRALTLLGFASLDAAARAALDLRSAGPVSCDLLDQRLLSLTRASDHGGLIPTGIGAALVVAFEADTEREAVALGDAAVERLRDGHRLAALADPTCDPAGVARIQAVRASAVNGLYGLGHGPRPVAFIEDVGVPPDALPEYLTQVQAILRHFELTGSLLAHALTGQVHARPLVDMNAEADRAKLWPVAEAVHAAALALGGTVSTQHGTGLARTPWVEKQYGPLAPVFRELKRIFDPKDVLNPGKIVGPDPSRPAWPLRRDTGHGTRDTGPEAGESLGPPLPRAPLLVWNSTTPAAEAAACNGCGDCRPRARGERMCPVFHAVGSEASSPRGKANLVRLLSAPDADPAALSGDDARAVADLCVNCKMCRPGCPAGVDVPKLMAETKAAYQAAHGLDRADWLFARAAGLAAFGSHFAPLVNVLLARPSARWLLEKLFGLSRRRRLPAFAHRSFLNRARGQGLSRKSSSRQVVKSGDRDLMTCGLDDLTTRPVALFVDTFANTNDPLIAEAAVAVLRHHGVSVFVPPRQAGCGMAALTQGDVETAREAAARNVRLLADLVREGYRVVTPEPTAAVMLTQDYLSLLDDPDARLVAENTDELTSYLGRLHAAGRLRTDFVNPLDLTLGHHVPCHVKALGEPPAGPGLLALIPGLTVHTIDVSCSGMAGVYGLRAANHEASLVAGRPMLKELDRPRVLYGSTECSACRVQMQEGTGKRTLHPVQYLAYAYGLLPEVGAKLRRPLTDLVSE